VEQLSEIGQGGILLVGTAALLLYFHWGLAVTVCIAAIPPAVTRLKHGRIVYRWQRERTPMRRRAAYFSALLTKDQPAMEIRLFHIGRIFIQRFHDLRRQLYRERLAIATRRARGNLGAQAIAGLVTFAAYGFVIYQALHGAFTLGDLALFHQAFGQGRRALQSVFGGLSNLYEDSLFLIDVCEFLDLRPKVVELPNPKPVPRPIRSGIVFDRVSFHYPNTTRQTLRDVSLTIPAGRIVALVGENGSGKTTLVKLLCRLYDPTAGNITIDGVNLREFGIASHRREISVIFQDYMKYHLTAKENIWLGDADISPTDEKIIEAARLSGADEVIRSLPQGYDTMLGKLFDQGEELSIGQWQKIALARAFLRKTQIIILDEPTSATSARSEYEFFQKFRQLVSGQTAILISHRLSTVAMADRIFVMSNGSIVENGTHAELLELGGTYAQAFETQSRNYDVVHQSRIVQRRTQMSER
jgi:ATP-binding cassette subfamily B protein